MLTEFNEFYLPNPEIYYPYIAPVTPTISLSPDPIVNKDLISTRPPNVRSDVLCIRLRRSSPVSPHMRVEHI